MDACVTELLPRKISKLPFVRRFCACAVVATVLRTNTLPIPKIFLIVRMIIPRSTHSQNTLDTVHN